MSQRGSRPVSAARMPRPHVRGRARGQAGYAPVNARMSASSLSVGTGGVKPPSGARIERGAWSAARGAAGGASRCAGPRRAPAASPAGSEPSRAREDAPDRLRPPAAALAEDGARQDAAAVTKGLGGAPGALCAANARLGALGGPPSSEARGLNVRCHAHALKGLAAAAAAGGGAAPAPAGGWGAGAARLACAGSGCRAASAKPLGAASAAGAAGRFASDTSSMSVLRARAAAAFRALGVRAGPGAGSTAGTAAARPGATAGASSGALQRGRGLAEARPRGRVGRPAAPHERQVARLGGRLERRRQQLGVRRHLGPPAVLGDRHDDLPGAAAAPGQQAGEHLPPARARARAAQALAPHVLLRPAPPDPASRSAARPRLTQRGQVLPCTARPGLALHSVAGAAWATGHLARTCTGCTRCRPGART